MKKDYQFRYGSTAVTIPIDDDQVIGVIDGNTTKRLDDIKGALIDALDNPIESESLQTVASRASSIVIVISDMTRYWMRQDLIVPILVD